MVRRRKLSRQPEQPVVNPFHITRMDRNPPPPPPPPVGSAEPAPTDMFAARFDSPADALTFLAAIRDETARPRPPTWRAPDRAVWVAVHGYRTTQVELAWTLGGVVYRPDGPDLVSPNGRRYRWRDIQGWAEVSWVELATGVAPGPGTPEQPEVLVVTTGTLARWIIDRFSSADLDLRIATARLRPLFRAPSGDWAAVLIRVTAHRRAVPRSFAHALTGLPHTVVCRLSGGRLLIDERLTLPLPDADLARWVPDGQEWLLAGGLGVWQLTERGPEHAPPLRAAPSIVPPPAPSPGRLPADLGIEVTPVRDELTRSVDALLLDDEDLKRLRAFLTDHPVAERGFLVLGPGRHLFAEPGRAVSDIPFGVRLHRIGPGPLYQDVHYRLKPALPAGARARLFGVDEKTLVVLADGAHRLSLAHTVPVWSLWLDPTADADPAADPLSADAKAVLAKVDAAQARLDPPEEETADVRSAAQAELYTEGFQLEQRGRLAESASKYWEAGQPALAARLYELAAEADR